MIGILKGYLNSCPAAHRIMAAIVKKRCASNKIGIKNTPMTANVRNKDNNKYK